MANLLPPSSPSNKKTSLPSPTSEGKEPAVTANESLAFTDIAANNTVVTLREVVFNFDEVPIAQVVNIDVDGGASLFDDSDVGSCGGDVNKVVLPMLKSEVEIERCFQSTSEGYK